MSEQTTEDKDRKSEVLSHVPFGLRVAASWSWRLIAVGVVALFLVSVFGRLAQILLPVAIAMLIAAALEVAVNKLVKWKVPRGLAALICVFGLLASILALFALAGQQIMNSFSDLKDTALEGFDTFLNWLSEGPLHLSAEDIDAYMERIQDTLKNNADGIASEALGITGAVGGFVAGAVIMLLALFFFLKDGRSIWLWIVSTLPGHDLDERVDRAGRNAWSTLRRYTQTSAFVALVDAVGIGLGAWILGVPLAIPIGILVFLFSFIPLFGATLSGFIAVLIALVDGGWTTALLMLAVVLLVQQLEGNILYPWLFGKAVSLHPIVILLTVSAGTILAGFVGAVVAVPILAAITAFIKGLKREFVLDLSVEHPITGQIPIIKARSRGFFSKFRQAGGSSKKGRSDKVVATAKKPEPKPERTEAEIKGDPEDDGWP